MNKLSKWYLLIILILIKYTISKIILKKLDSLLKVEIILKMLYILIKKKLY